MMFLRLFVAAVVIASSFGDDRCPEVDPDQAGTCAEECSDPNPCTGGQVCCFNGCGHVCMNPVLDRDDDDDDDREGCRLQQLSEVAKDAFDSVRSGNSPAILITYLPDIARAGCLERLSSVLKKDTCTSEVFDQAVCSVHDINVIQAFTKCLAVTHRCPALTKIFITDEAKCIRDVDLSQVAELFFTENCEMPPSVLFLLPERQLLQYLSRQNRFSVLDCTWSDDPEFFQLLSCSKKKQVSSHITDYVSSWIMDHCFIPTIPYWVMYQCDGWLHLAETHSPLLNHLEEMKMLLYECGESDNIYDMVESNLRGHGIDLVSYLLHQQLGDAGSLVVPDAILDIRKEGICSDVPVCAMQHYPNFASVVSSLDGDLDLADLCQLEEGATGFWQCLHTSEACSAKVDAVRSFVDMVFAWRADVCTLTLKNRIFLTLYRLNRADSECKFECGAELANIVVDLLEENNTEVNLGNARNMLGNIAECLDFHELIDSVEVGDCRNLNVETIKEIEAEDRKELARNCLENRIDHDYTDVELLGVGCLIFSLKPSVLKRINTDQLCRLLASDLLFCLDEDIIKSVSPSVIEYVRRMCEDNDAVVQKLQERRIEDSRGDTAEQNREDAKREKERGRMARARVFNFIAAEKLNATDITYDEEVAVTIPSASLKQRVEKEKANIADLVVSGTTKAQKIVLVKLYLEWKNWTLEDLEEDDLMNMRQLLRGLNHLDVARICARKPVLCIQTVYQKLATTELHLSGKVVKELTDLWRDMLKTLAVAMDENLDRDMLKAADYMSHLSAAEVDSLIPQVVRHIRIEELQAASSDVREAILRNLARDEGRACSELMAGQRAEQAQFALENFGEEEAGFKHIEIAPLLVDATDISFGGKFVTNGGPVAMAACPFCLPPRIADKIISRLKPYIVDTLQLENLGCWSISMLTDNLQQNQRDHILKYVRKHIDTIHAASMCSDEKEVKCRLGTLNDSGKNRVDELKQQVVDVLAKVAQENQMEVEEDQGLARKKRAVYRTRRQASMYLCQTLQAMDPFSVLVALTEENIDAMDNDEFLDCITTLGRISGWSANQARTMFTKALTVLDTTACNLTDAILSDLGTIVYSLTPPEISCLKIDLDMMTTLGQLSMWTTDQMMASARQFLTFNNLDPETDLTADALVALGHILCGLEDMQIKAIAPEEYWSASAVIGNLETAPVSCLRSLVALATHENAYGPLSGWTSPVYIDIGIVLGGLTGEELKAADEDDYTGFQGNGISHLPAGELNKLSVSDLRQLSRAQLLEITDEQRAGLSNVLHEELDCLVKGCEDDEEDKGDGNDDNDDNDGRGGNGPIAGVAEMTFSLGTLLSACLVTLMLRM